MFVRFAVGLIVLLGVQTAPLWAVEPVLTLPDQAALTLELREPLATRSFATGPFQAGGFATKTVTAPVQDSAYRLLADANLTTASLLAPLRGQLSHAGFAVLYECASQTCGGFDFRYGLELLPEPEMHVDLGDFRYVLAQKGQDVISLMVSRSPHYGFVQVTRMGDAARPAPRVTESSKSPALATPIARALSAGSVVVMGGVVFASGQAQLENTQASDLRDLADWLVANPMKRVTMTGHTDSSGQASANLALSAARANALRDVLVAQYQIAADRIIATGAGDTAPLAPNDTAEGRAKNRRVEVAVTP